MTRSDHSNVVESAQSLWTLAIPLSLWLIHFLFSYAAAALWCGTVGRQAPLGPVGVGFALITASALIGIATAGWRGWRRYRHANESGASVPSHHKDTPEDRHRFLGLATFLLAALSAIATIYAAIAVVLMRNCG